MVRPLREGDRNFARKNWQEAFVGWLLPHGLMSERTAMKRRFYIGMNRLLDTRNSVVACDSDDSNHLLGFACGQKAPAVLHYVYVKPIYRRCGLARALVAAACGPAPVIACTHWGWGLPRDAADELVVDEVRLSYVGPMEPPQSTRMMTDHDTERVYRATAS